MSAADSCQVWLAEWMGTQVAVKELICFQDRAKDEVHKRKGRLAKQPSTEDDDDGSDRYAVGGWSSVDTAWSSVFQSVLWLNLGLDRSRSCCCCPRLRSVLYIPQEACDCRLVTAGLWACLSVAPCCACHEDQQVALT